MPPPPADAVARPAGEAFGGGGAALNGAAFGTIVRELPPLGVRPARETLTPVSHGPVFCVDGRWGCWASRRHVSDRIGATTAWYSMAQDCVVFSVHGVAEDSGWLRTRANTRERADWWVCGQRVSKPSTQAEGVALLTHLFSTQRHRAAMGPEPCGRSSGSCQACRCRHVSQLLSGAGHAPEV